MRARSVCVQETQDFRNTSAANYRRFGLGAWRVTKILFVASILITPFAAQAQFQSPQQKTESAPLLGLRPDYSSSLQAEDLFSETPRARRLQYSFSAQAFETDSEAQGPAGSPTFETAEQGVRLNLGQFFAAMNRPAAPATADEQLSGRYNVKGLLWQSLAFTGVELSYRLSTDSYMRYLIAHGPYWEDYIRSMQHWDMTRWSDGDDFLVDDIGHPMQGAVSAFIEIQNSPRQRVLRVSWTKAYWRSRFLAMMWATVFSTQQKIGPLGEAALGNDGGYTYIPGCRFGCPTYVPGKTVYLNNTGWTDFIMTPVGGTAWSIFEDLLDREVSDRVQNAMPNHVVFPNILRAALNPARSMANFVRWRNPWYRDFQHYPVNRHITPGIHFVPSDEDTVSNAPRYEIFPHFNAISLPVNTAGCTACRRMIPGFGVGFAARLARWVDFDSDLDYQSNASPVPSSRAGGDAILGTFGFRTGLQYAHYALKAALRPGFLSYSNAYETDSTTGIPTANLGRITHFVTAMAINGDYDVSRHFALRAVVSNIPVRYRKPNIGKPGVGTPPYLNWLSHEYFSTNENWAYQTGVVLRF
jgi:hypothetical protein